jgi:hypothetical protein
LLVGGVQHRKSPLILPFSWIFNKATIIPFSSYVHMRDAMMKKR